GVDRDCAADDDGGVGIVACQVGLDDEGERSGERTGCLPGPQPRIAAGFVVDDDAVAGEGGDRGRAVRIVDDPGADQRMTGRCDGGTVLGAGGCTVVPGDEADEEQRDNRRDGDLTDPAVHGTLLCSWPPSPVADGLVHRTLDRRPYVRWAMATTDR